MKFLLIVNKDKSNSQKFADEVIKEIASCGASYSLLEKESSQMDGDIAILIGGDGTVLINAVSLAKNKLPIFMINTGGLGFLANINTLEDIKLSIKKLINNE